VEVSRGSWRAGIHKRPLLSLCLVLNEVKLCVNFGIDWLEGVGKASYSVQSMDGNHMVHSNLESTNCTLPDIRQSRSVTEQF
jgi:hypothetical protein